MNVNWNYPTLMWVGENRVKNLIEACKELEISNPLFITDKDLINLDMIKQIIHDLKKNFKNLEIFSNFSGNPIGQNVEEGVKKYNRSKCNGVIAIGGGSAIDVGKATAFMCGQKRPIWDFEDIGEYWKRANKSKIARIIAIPTTAGTGSETGRAAVIIDENTHMKKIIFHPRMLPSIVILDPLLTLDLSPRLTAGTGMDALAHNLEAFCAPGFHPMADGIAIEGIKLIKKYLITAYKDGKNIEARMNLLSASSMGATAFQKGLGAIHSLSHPINSKFGVHHGLSNAIFMPYVLSFNKSEIEQKILEICNSLSLDKDFNSFLEWILELRKNLNIPHKLSDIMDCNKINLDELSLMAFQDPSTGGNPKKINQSDLKKMYEMSISGKLF